MSGFLSDKFLKYHGKGALGKVKDDVPCSGCGYNLRGLNYGRNCPECGSQILRTATHDVLLAGDATDRGSWRLGLAIAFGSVVAATAARVVVFVLAMRGVDLEKAYVLTGLVLSILWVCAAWMTTPRLVAKRWPWMGPARAYVRVSALLFPVAYLFLLVSLGGGSAKLATLAGLMRLVAGVGVVVLAVMLARIAEEAQRETAARRLNAAVWLLAIATLIPLLFGANVYWFLIPLLVFFQILWVWVMTLFALGLLDLYHHVHWTMVLADRLHTRTQRVSETRREMEDDIEASIRPLPPARPDIPFDPQGEERRAGRDGVP